jgi:hypothetical protein
MRKAARYFSGLLLAAGLCLLAPAVWAGAPEGHPQSLEQDLQQTLYTTLEREGYIGTFYAGVELQRGISAYLWDNRVWLVNTDFNNARQVDVLVCLLVKKGYGGFQEYAENQSFMNWCGDMVHKP